MGLQTNVLCVYWQGEFRNRPYKPVWVHRLRDMVARHLGDFNFYCLSNVDIPGVEVIRLRNNYPGWWSKVELFRDDLPKGRNLYLDLDALVVGSLQELVDLPHSIAFHPPGYVVHNSKPAGGPNICDEYNSSVIVWNSGECLEFYQLFDLKYINRFRGDQDWFGWCIPELPLIPSHWLDRLRFCKDGPKPGVKIILAMPDKNERASQIYPWVRDIWIGEENG